ncbi:unnamed protein product [Bursaphelenchus xylophilus]|uniref:(pine wood nematode) hypothetical protein n=1 Tax=Bursaphelenchus xylophilus TaxID=6326 RepID=A0A811K744_BURXY|nr:unnamed protein product [Bursaphelenchus xylophilus]CAG9088552.1 unnamed protein product [Bursaphelenchus xylophilus]
MEFRHHWTVFWTNGQFFTGLMSPNNVGQASGHRSSPASERQAHSAQAEQLPAVMAPPLVGQHPTGVPEEEPAPTDQADHLPAVEGSERSLDMDFSSFSDCSSSTSEEHSTLHDVPSIRSLEIFDEGAACEETLADQNDRLRFQRDFWKTQCRTLWERQETFEKKVKFYQEALVEAEVEAKKAKEAASVATKKAEEERALKEAAEKEVAELQARLLTHLRTAVADDRPPRAERSRSRSPLMRTAWSITPTTAEILRIDVTQPPATQHPPPPADQGYEVQEQNHEAPGPLRRMPKCKRRCCYQPSADPQRPRPPRRSRELQGLGPVLQEEDNGPEEHQRPRRERRPPSRLIVDMASRSYRTSQEPRSKGKSILSGQKFNMAQSFMPNNQFVQFNLDKQPRGLTKCTQTLVRPAGTRKKCPTHGRTGAPGPPLHPGALWNTCGCSVKTGTKGREAPWPPE